MEANGKVLSAVDRADPGADYIVIRVSATRKLLFVLGMLCGSVVLRQETLSMAFQSALTAVRGYEYNSEDECVVMRKKSGKLDYCRPLVECNACRNVSFVAKINASDMTPELFLAEFAYSGRPLVVTNLTGEWRATSAFDFEFFRDLYRDLDSPVLDNVEDDCQFFAWDFSEFNNMDEVFSMPEDRFRMLGNYSPWYVGWADCDPEARDFLRDFYTRPFFLPDKSESGKRDWFFIGTPGYGAPFHLDRVRYPSWQAQIRGRKMWKLRPPPECYWTCPGEISVVLNPGDVIVVDTNQWFHSTNVIEDLSVTITNEYK